MSGNHTSHNVHVELGPFTSLKAINFPSGKNVLAAQTVASANFSIYQKEVGGVGVSKVYTDFNISDTTTSKAVLPIATAALKPYISYNIKDDGIYTIPTDTRPLTNSQVEKIAKKLLTNNQSRMLYWYLLNTLNQGNDKWLIQSDIAHQSVLNTWLWGLIRPIELKLNSTNELILSFSLTDPITPEANSAPTGIELYPRNSVGISDTPHQVMYAYTFFIFTAKLENLLSARSIGTITRTRTVPIYNTSAFYNPPISSSEGWAGIYKEFSNITTNNVTGFDISNIILSQNDIRQLIATNLGLSKQEVITIATWQESGLTSPIAHDTSVRSLSVNTDMITGIYIDAYELKKISTNAAFGPAVFTQTPAFLKNLNLVMNPETGIYSLDSVTNALLNPFVFKVTTFQPVGVYYGGGFYNLNTIVKGVATLLGQIDFEYSATVINTNLTVNGKGGGNIVLKKLGFTSNIAGVPNETYLSGTQTIDLRSEYNIVFDMFRQTTLDNGISGKLYFNGSEISATASFNVNTAQRNVGTIHGLGFSTDEEFLWPIIDGKVSLRHKHNAEAIGDPNFVTGSEVTVYNLAPQPQQEMGGPFITEYPSFMGVFSTISVLYWYKADGVNDGLCVIKDVDGLGAGVIVYNNIADQGLIDLLLLKPSTYLVL